MKLNPDCVRNVLLTVEFMTNGRCHFSFHSDEDMQALIDKSSLLMDYTCDEVDYHFIQCIQSRYIQGQMGAQSGFIFSDLTPEGHDFLANIRSDTNWKATKNVLGKMGTFALSMVQSVAAGVAQAAINSQLGFK